MAPDQNGGYLRRVWSAYRLRWKRRELLWRSIRARRRLRPVADRTGHIAPDDILVFAALRNEAARLPEFLAHYRGLGVAHFLFVDNGSDDGSVELVRDQPDASLWLCGDGYRRSRFGMDWIGALLMRHGHGHWCLTVDIDELLIYPDHDRRDLRALTRYLDDRAIPGLGALMLELYPQARLGQAEAPDDAPLLARLPWFDAGPYRTRIMSPKRNRWVQGGVRERAFFPDRPGQSPTLNKLPLIRWNWRYAYVNSTHSLLPPHLNDLYDGPGDPRLSGILLHGKFLPQIIEKSTEELDRRQHFTNPSAYVHYHRALTGEPVLWNQSSTRYRDWQQLVDLGLMGTGDWVCGPEG
ncbi:glycosyltransferase family 2 protein [Paracoccus sp. (in: a-proteobacteria)]|uniref:glycosyltransferase family 2 protein n=1 Tax=Paracoccus sp. TaxID=267 RepID=UPI003A8BEF86